MRLIDADELMEHAWRDKLDSRELIAGMIANAPTIKEIPTKIPIGIFEKLVSQEPFMNKPCIANQVCHEDKVKVLDRIRAEIDEQYDKVHPYNLSYAEGLEMALGIIEKYKSESEVKQNDT